MSIEREEQLKQMGFADLRKLAQSYDIEKPLGGWQEAIPQILEKEAIITGDRASMTDKVDEAELTQGAVETATPIAIKTADVAIVTQPKIELNPEDFRFSTEYYQKLGFKVCPKCGSKKVTENGKTVCAIANEDCPMI